MNANDIRSAIGLKGNGAARASGAPNASIAQPSSPTSRRGPWRARAALLLTGAVLVLANVAVLVSYNAFYDARVLALGHAKEDLTRRRNEARASVESVVVAERRLGELKEGLETFYGSVLGARRDRLAPLIAEIHDITRTAGFVPASIAYAEEPIPGAERIALMFQVAGRYAEIKKLLYAFEAHPGFLVLEAVNIGSDEGEDLLRVGLTVAHYFREDSASGRRTARPARPAPRRPGPVPTPVPGTGALE